MDTEAVNVRMHRLTIDSIDTFRASLRPIPSRPEAIRRLVEIGLESMPIVKEMLEFLDRHGDTSDPETQATIERLRGIVSG